MPQLPIAIDSAGSVFGVAFGFLTYRCGTVLDSHQIPLKYAGAYNSAHLTLEYRPSCLSTDGYTERPT
ncbi:hypothetical protein GCM10025785_05950 [Corynebacterium canis]